ncbi:MAG TPA: zf-HC2 domain-containing protein [Bacteroidales bacterium]|nr:zf-HC2 domain-containing protein [Bacteroidales bacterium]
MKCEEVGIRMTDYLDNNLDEETRREIEKHLETCESCLDEFKEGQKILNAMSKNEMEQPDESLRINFYHMLHNEIKKEEDKNRSLLKPAIPWYNIAGYRIAAGIALLIAGTFIGLFVRTQMNNTIASKELAQLHSEVSDLKRTALFTMLKDESSSDRIQAVNYATDLGNADNKVIEVLVKTLNYDKNVNVRLASVYALSKFTDQQAVTDSLVKSLSLQTDPIVQVALINILAERKVKSALKPIQEIISNRNTLKEVRDVAENSLHVLI